MGKKRGNDTEDSIKQRLVTALFKFCFEELTPTLLREFVEKILIHESEALDGKRRWKLRRQEIEIYHSFVGKAELHD